MKKYFSLFLSLLILMIPVLGIAETQKFLKTPVAEIEVTAEGWCSDDGLRATLAVALQLSLMQQEGISEGHFEPNATYVGYNEQSAFVVSALSETERAVFELDTEYHICKYYIDTDADMTQNETICKELCPEYCWVTDQKEVESAFYSLLK